jgi:hypothetical protein
MATKKQGGYTKEHWLRAMNEVAVPVAMTSLVNLCMFATIAIMSDVPIVEDAAWIAVYCIVALNLSILFCFPAYCYLDLKRQEAGRVDVLFCLQSPVTAWRNHFSDKFYDAFILASDVKVRSVVHAVVFLVSCTLLIIGAWGVSQREVGLGLDELFPPQHPAGRWASLRTQELASWPISINWGALNYTDPLTQMKMIKQFEDVVATPHVVDVDTKQVWIANFAIWTSRQCSNNLNSYEFDGRKCGRDQLFDEEDSYCTGHWVQNKLGLRETNMITEGGICRQWHRMHIDDLNDMGLNDESAEDQTFCPVIQGWSDAKWKFCLTRWRFITGTSERFALEDDHGSPTDCGGVYLQDEEITWPLPLTEGPSMFAVDLFSHQLTLDMMADVRVVCDDDKELHCWISGIPFEYWTQYDGIFKMLVELAGYTILVGFGVSLLFLFATLSLENHHAARRVFIGSLIGSILITVTVVSTLIAVVGISVLSGVSLTGFSSVTFLLTGGFAVKYSVHLVSRWIRTDMSHSTSLDRVRKAMSLLMLPNLMSFASLTIGVVCLALSEFAVNKMFYFRPLLIVMFVSYWFGCWFLPVLLIYLDFDMVKLGKPAGMDTAVAPKEGPVVLVGGGGGYGEEDDLDFAPVALGETPTASFQVPEFEYRETDVSASDNDDSKDAEASVSTRHTGEVSA